MDQIKPFGAEFHFNQRVESLERSMAASGSSPMPAP